MPQPNIEASLVLVGLVLALLGAILLAWAWIFARLVLGEHPFARGLLPRAPWGFFTAFGALLLWQGTMIGLVVGYASWKGKGLAVDLSAMLVLNVATNGAMLLLLPAWTWITSRARPADLGITADGLPRKVATGLVACLAAAPVVYAVQFACAKQWKPEPHPILQMLRDDPTGSRAFLAILAAVVIGPALEELLFRGILLGWLERVFSGKPAPKRFDPTPSEILLEAPVGALVPTSLGDDLDWRAPYDAPAESSVLPTEAPSPTTLPYQPLAIFPNLITSVIFAGLHFQQWPAPLALFPLSMVFGYLYRRTGSLVAPYAAHALFNGISTTMLLVAVRSGVPLPN